MSARSKSKSLKDDNIIQNLNLISTTFIYDVEQEGQGFQDEKIWQKQENKRTMEINS